MISDPLALVRYRINCGPIALGSGSDDCESASNLYVPRLLAPTCFHYFGPTDCRVSPQVEEGENWTALPGHQPILVCSVSFS